MHSNKHVGLEGLLGSFRFSSFMDLVIKGILFPPSLYATLNLLYPQYIPYDPVWRQNLLRRWKEVISWALIQWLVCL